MKERESGYVLLWLIPVDFKLSRYLNIEEFFYGGREGHFLISHFHFTFSFLISRSHFSFRIPISHFTFPFLILHSHFAFPFLISQSYTHV